MNKELYLEIKKYLNSSALPPQKVSADLGEYIKNYSKTPVDKFTIVYSFYEYMSLKFSFVNMGEWKKYFELNFSNFLTDERINEHLDVIISDDVLNNIMKASDNRVIYKIYNCLNNRKLESMRYMDALNKVTRKCIELGIIADVRSEDTENKTNSFISVSKNSYNKLKNKITTCNNFASLNLRVLSSKKLTSLTIKGQSVFDKIATTEAEVVRKIASSAKEKKELLKIIVKPNKNLISKIKLETTYNKFFNDSMVNNFYQNQTGVFSM